jgi:tripartite-type tricarboxylate transporter receptor subunit TctC
MCLLVLFGSLVSSPLFAQAGYPAKPVKLLVPFPPGGPTDVAARVFAQSLADALGQQVVIDNRGGGGGTLGAGVAAREPADGYSLFYGSTSTLALAPHLYKNIPYDPVKSFTAVSLVAQGPMVLVVNPRQGVSTLAELVALAKAKPGALNYGSAGNGTPPHLAAELFKSVAGIDALHVPYKGAAPAMTDVIGGSLSFMFASPAGLGSFIQGGKVRALAITGPRRVPGLPDVPTSAEAGMPALTVSSWNGLVAPAGVSRDVLAKLNQAVHAAVKSDGLRTALTRQGMQAVGSSPEEFAAFVREEHARWADVIRKAGIKPD